MLRRGPQTLIPSSRASMTHPCNSTIHPKYKVRDNTWRIGLNTFLIFFHYIVSISHTDFFTIGWALFCSSKGFQCAWRWAWTRTLLLFRQSSVQPDMMEHAPLMSSSACPGYPHPLKSPSHGLQIANTRSQIGTMWHSDHCHCDVLADDDRRCA